MRPSSPSPNPADASTPTLQLRLALNADALDANDRAQFREALAAVALPVAKVGTPYRATINLATILRANARRVDGARFDLCASDSTLPPIGLECRLDDDALFLEGTPTQTLRGQVELIVEIAKTPLAPIALPLIVHPDIWSLWKILPSPSGPYPVEDEISFAAPFPGDDRKIVLAASQRGRSHEHYGKFRDDAFAVNLDAFDGWSFLAVADGAGSARFSRQGAKIACETVVAKLATRFQEAFRQGNLREPFLDALRSSAPDASTASLDGAQVPPQLVGVFHQTLWETFMQIAAERDAFNQALPSGEKPAQLRDFYTTLLCCAVKKYPNKNRWTILSYWVGDGCLAIYAPNGRPVPLPLGLPDGGEFAGQTRFFTSKEEIALEPIQRRFRAAILDDFDALVMATDGVADPYFEIARDLEDPERWRQFWNLRGPDELFQGVFDSDVAPKKRAERLLKGLRFKVQDNHDDRTILLLLDPERFADDGAARRASR